MNYTHYALSVLTFINYGITVLMAFLKFLKNPDPMKTLGPGLITTDPSPSHWATIMCKSDAFIYCI